MKKPFVLVLILSVLILAACGSVDVSYQLSEDDIINADYTINISDTATDAAVYLKAIEEYWDDMGFDTERTNENDVEGVSGRKEIKCDSCQHAAEEFSEMLTSDAALFYDVVFEYAPDMREDHYTLSASVSFKDVIRQSEAQNIPPNELDAITQNAKSGTYALSLSLPGEVVHTNADKTNADKTNGTLCIWDLEYGETAHITLETKLINQDNIDKYEGLVDDLDRDRVLVTIFIAAGGVLVIVIIVLLILRGIRKRRV